MNAPIHEFVIERLIPGGEGLSRDGGMVTFIPGALPGERVAAGIEEEKPGWRRTGLPRILEASPHRQNPFCPLYGTCGGCSWQHFHPEAQVQAKIDIVRETWKRQAGLTVNEGQVFSSASDKAYRARIRVAVDRDGRPGFRQSRSRDVIAVEHCPVAVEGLNRFFQDDHPDLRAGDEVMVFGNRREYWLQGRDSLATAEVKNRVFQFPPGAFFQSHIDLVGDLVDSVVSARSGDVALDLFGGVGLFGAFLTNGFRRVIGIDKDPLAAEAWTRHVGSRGEFHSRTLEHWLKSARKIREPDFLVVDPPRTGLSKEVRRFLTEIRPKQMAYVSCDPVTQGRDLAALIGRGYRLDSWALFDFYPHTPHIETVVHLSRAHD